MQRWRRQALDLFSLLVMALHTPMSIAALYKNNIPIQSKILVVFALLFMLSATAGRVFPLRWRIWFLIAAMWVYATAMLLRGGAALGFRTVMVTTPVSIMLLGGIPTGLVYAGVNLTGIATALWASNQGFLPTGNVAPVPGEWLFQLLPFVGTIVPNVTLLAWFSYFLMTSIRRQYNTAQRLREEATQRERLEQELEEAAEQEQQRIGCELHDGVCQELTGLMLLTKRVQRAQGSPATVGADPELLSSLAEGLGHAIGEIHGISRRLSPGLLGPEGLSGAIHDLVRRYAEVTEIRFEFVEAGPVSLPQTFDALNVYRIAQEALANAVRHSGATNIVVGLSTSEQRLCLRIDDNGHGIPADAQNGSGLGLRTMRWRAQRGNGTLAVEPLPSGGTRVEYTWHLMPAQTDDFATNGEPDVPR